MGSLSDFGSLLLLITFFPTVVIALIVFTRNQHSSINRAFALMSLTISLWAASSILSDATSNYQMAKVTASSAFAFGILALFTTLIFWRYFFGIGSKKSTSLILISGLIVAAVSATPLVYQLDDLNNYTNGTLYTQYLMIAGLLAASIIWVFIRNYKKADVITKNQARFTLAGFLALLVLAATTNAIIPAFYNIDWITKLGPSFTVLFIGATAYSILKHRLFDIRFIVARSLAYILSLSFIAIIYAVIVFGVVQSLFAVSTPELKQQIFYIIFAIFTALIFQPVKRRFDKLTNRVFYRDAYDTQAFLDELNTALVTNFKLNEILSISSKILNKYLKSDFASFNIHLPDGQPVSNSHQINLTPSQIHLLRQSINPHKTKVLVATNLETGHKLLPTLQNHSVAAVICLAAHNDIVGYLFLGEKKSGNMYSAQDEKMMEIIGEELAIAIQNALRFEQISQFNITLQQKIDEATMKLRHANARLKELDETKDEFISMASHQLRTPLTTIKGYLSLILDGDTGPVKPQQKEMMQQAFDSASRMVYLIADLLNVSRLQSGKFVITNKPTELVKVVEGEIKQLDEQIANRKIKMSFDKPSNFPTLNLDEDKMRQVIMNFLDNALYYTPAGGTVTASLTVSAQSVSFTVSDTGVGVPKSVQHHLFSKFYRADNARKMRPDGTGLGLYMAKKVITAQGGAIIFKSTEGKGSTFGFSLPLKTVASK